MEYLTIDLKGIDENGTETDFTLGEFNGDKVLVYFYPKDNTPGCTIEAKNFRDNMNKLAEKVIIVGVSPDKIDSHRDFQKENELDYILLSDPDKKLAKAFKVDNGDMIERSTFLLDEDGKIEKEWRDVDPQTHVDEIIEYLEM